MTTRTVAAILVALAAGCGSSSRPVDSATPTATATSTSTSTSTSTPTATPTPTSTADAPATSTPTAASPPAPAKPPPPPAPAIRSAIAREPSGTTPLSATGETVVDAASTFEVELAPRLADARIVLVDAGDGHVAAKDVRELTATTRLTLAPEAPLVPGSRYVLRADGAAQREMHDADGRAFAPVGFSLLVAGTPPPPEPKKAPKKKRRAR